MYVHLINSCKTGHVSLKLLISQVWQTTKQAHSNIKNCSQETITVNVQLNEDAMQHQLLNEKYLAYAKRYLQQSSAHETNVFADGNNSLNTMELKTFKTTQELDYQ